MVEDNPGDAFLVEEYLHEYIAQLKLTWVASFQEARRHMLSDEHFDAILMDLTLPDCAGQVLIDSVLALVKDIPVIVLTGYGDQSFAAQSIRQGISDYLLKDELDGALLYRSIRYSIEGKKYVSALKHSEKRYGDLFQMSPQPAWCLDMQTQSFLDVNDAAIAHYGYSRDEFSSLTLKDLCRSSCEKLTMQVLAEKDLMSYFEGVYFHYKKNGEQITVELKTRSIYHQGQWACLMLVNDVTAQREYIKNIEHQNKMLQDIAWMQSHEVRAPLARILGLIQLLQMSDEGPSGQQNAELLSAIQHSSEELDQMIHTMVRKTEAVQALLHQSPLFLP